MPYSKKLVLSAIAIARQVEIDRKFVVFTIAKRDDRDRRFLGEFITKIYRKKGNNRKEIRVFKNHDLPSHINPRSSVGNFSFGKKYRCDHPSRSLRTDGSHPR